MANQQNQLFARKETSKKGDNQEVRNISSFSKKSKKTDQQFNDKILNNYLKEEKMNKRRILKNIIRSTFFPGWLPLP